MSENSGEKRIDLKDAIVNLYRAWPDDSPLWWLDLSAVLQCSISASYDKEGKDPIYEGQHVYLITKTIDVGKPLPVWFHFSFMNTGLLPAQKVYYVGDVWNSTAQKHLYEMYQENVVSLDIGESFKYSKQLPYLSSENSLSVRLEVNEGDQLKRFSESHNSDSFHCVIYNTVFTS